MVWQIGATVRHLSHLVKRILIEPSAAAAIMMNKKLEEDDTTTPPSPLNCGLPNIHTNEGCHHTFHRVRGYNRL